MFLLTQRTDRGLCLQQAHRGKATQEDHDLRAQERQLTIQEGSAALHFIFVRIAIVLRTALQDVDDGHVFSTLPTAFVQDVFQQLATLTDKGLAL